MNSDIINSVSRKNDSELLYIVNKDRHNYPEEFIETAINELRSRGIDISYPLADRTDDVEDEIELDEAGKFKRFIHMVVDMIIIISIAIVITMGLELLFGLKNGMAILDLIIYPLIFVLYYGIMENKFQRTVGKFLTGTKVVDYNGDVPGIARIIGRTLCRLIPFENFSFLFFQDGFHDSLSKTAVINFPKK